MARSIDRHMKHCSCPVCEANRKPHVPTRVLSVRVREDVAQYVQDQPEGARAWVEKAVARERGDN